ncbi:EI24 domain-containing protein [Actimicrobium antarcticum]|uniref:EI24 domain-containing protein n=1 Tax=Actimicrobium antarcticum TaxID=1051899 RepID=A0ABP7SYB6_9BURK
MHPVLASFFRAVWSQLHARMLLLTLMPFLLSVVIWGVVLWLGFQPLIDWVHSWFLDNDGFRIVGNVLGWFGLGAIKTVIVPLLAMWVLLPLMILTALVFIGTLAMPVIVKHVASRRFPTLEQRGSGSILGSLWIAFSSFCIFLLLWLVTLPLSAIPPLGFLVQPVLWGWLTYRVLAYDALSAHADTIELHAILRDHKWPLLLIGAITGAMGAMPTLLWLGGALSVVFFPVLAALSIWLYVLVFVFTGLWFQHYCLAALTRQRLATSHSTSTIQPD